MSVGASYDLYALAPERSRTAVERFRDAWLVAASPTAVEYEFPRYADEPEVVYESPWELVDRLLAMPDEPHSLYWRLLGAGAVLHGMLFFTTDGGLIAGLTVAGDSPADAARALRRLAASVDADCGYATSEEPPPETAVEFRAKAAAAAIRLTGA